MPDAGVCIATGYNNLVALDIDDDALVDPILAVLPDVLVAKRGRWGQTVFVRSSEAMASTPYDGPDGRLLDLLSIGKQTVLPPTVHPDLNRPYEWLTPATLLDTPISELPLFTYSHREAMEEVLRSFGWAAREPKQPPRDLVANPVNYGSTDSSWHGDVNTVALANLAAWVLDLGLPKTRQNGIGYRAVAPWRGSGSGRAEAQRSQNLSFHPNGIVDFGSGETFTPIRVVARSLAIPNPAAVAWLRQRLGLPEERLILANAAKSGRLKPTYPDHAISLADATAELCRTLDAFEAEMKEWRIYRNAAHIKAPLIRRKPPVWGVKIETGGGKSFQGARKVAEWSKLGWRLAYVVPTIRLGKQIEKDMTRLGVKAQVYRGREQDDPTTLGKTMCQNLPAANAAIALGLSVRPAVCARRIDEKLVQCPFATVCGHERQREAKPDVWIVTAASLAYEKPDFLPELDGVVADEQFHKYVVGDTMTINVSELALAKIEHCTDEEHDFLIDMRAKLQAVVKENGRGALSAIVLDEHRIYVHDALRAAALEQRLVKPDILRPDMKESGLNLAVRKHEARNTLARGAGILWEQIALFLAFDHPQSGRIAVASNSFSVTPLLSVHPSWLAPTLALDATLPPVEMLNAAVFGDEVAGVASTIVLKADIAIEWPSAVRVRQIIDARVSMNALGIGERAKPHPRNERDILRFIRHQAALVAPACLGVISYLGLKDRIAGQAPSNVQWMHFGATSGLNYFETVAGLIVIGRWWNAPEKVEARASVFAGYSVKPIGEEYKKRTGGIRMTKGPAVARTVECHPDPFAEAVRRGVTEDELSQAIGRLRPHRRDRPCFLDIVGDVVLPVTVDEVAEWEAILPGAGADMMAEGVVLTNVADARKAFGLSEWEARGVGGFLMRDSHRETTDSSPFRTFRYRKAGAGQKEYEGHYLPGVLPGGERALRTWLEAKLGPLASLQVERAKAKVSAQARAAFERIGRDTTARLERPMAAYSQAMTGVEEFFEGLG